MSFKAYTDYPFTDGDYGLKEVDVISYDRNKYCEVVWNGVDYEVKAGYVYMNRELTKRPNESKLYSLPVVSTAPVPTRRQVARVLKELRRRKTTYYVSCAMTVGWGLRGSYTSLKEALAAYKTGLKDGRSPYLEIVRSGSVFQSAGLMYEDCGKTTVFTNQKERAILKSKRLRKAGIL